MKINAMGSSTNTTKTKTKKLYRTLMPLIVTTTRG
jgi:hypothetical protein